MFAIQKLDNSFPMNHYAIEIPRFQKNFAIGHTTRP